MIAMIIPLIPIVAAGVTSISQRLAATQKKAAELEKSKFETENDRLVLVKERTELENSRLRFEQVKLEESKETLEARVRQLAESERQLVDAFFQRYENVCGIGGRIVTAKDYETAQAKYAEFNAFDVLAIDPRIASPIKRVGEQLEEWQSSGTRPVDRQLERAVLQVSIACKNAFKQQRTDQFRRHTLQLTMDIYEEAEQMVKDLEAAEDFSAAEETVDRFWELYYGKLVLVESPGVAGAMVQSGEALKAWTQGPPNQAVLKRLSESFRREYKMLMESLEESDARKPGVKTETS